MDRQVHSHKEKIFLRNKRKDRLTGRRKKSKKDRQAGRLINKCHTDRQTNRQKDEQAKDGQEDKQTYRNSGARVHAWLWPLSHFREDNYNSLPNR